MRGAIWWIDRWRASSAFRELTLEEQGAYRNLLDECWLAEGGIPNTERALSMACGDPAAWPRLRDAVLKRFALDPLTNTWRHPVVDRVLHESRRKARNQRTYRAGLALRLAGFPKPESPVANHVTGNVAGNVPRSLDQENHPDPDARARSTDDARAEGSDGGRARNGAAKHAEVCEDPMCCEDGARNQERTDEDQPSHEPVPASPAEAPGPFSLDAEPSATDDSDPS